MEVFSFYICSFALNEILYCYQVCKHFDVHWCYLNSACFPRRQFWIQFFFFAQVFCSWFIFRATNILQRQFSYQKIKRSYRNFFWKLNISSSSRDKHDIINSNFWLLQKAQVFSNYIKNNFKNEVANYRIRKHMKFKVKLN